MIRNGKPHRRLIPLPVLFPRTAWQANEHGLLAYVEIDHGNCRVQCCGRHCTHVANAPDAGMTGRKSSQSKSPHGLCWDHSPFQLSPRAAFKPPQDTPPGPGRCVHAHRPRTPGGSHPEPGETLPSAPARTPWRVPDRRKANDTDEPAPDNGDRPGRHSRRR